MPGLNRCTFLTPPVFGAVLRADLAASCLRGALPPVDLRAVCLVLDCLVPAIVLCFGFLFCELARGRRVFGVRGAICYDCWKRQLLCEAANQCVAFDKNRQLAKANGWFLVINCCDEALGHVFVVVIVVENDGSAAGVAVVVHVNNAKGSFEHLTLQRGVQQRQQLSLATLLRQRRPLASAVERVGVVANPEERLRVASGEHGGADVDHALHIAEHGVAAILVLVLIDLEHEGAAVRVERKLGLGKLFRLIKAAKADKGLPIKGDAVIVEEFLDAALALVDFLANPRGAGIVGKQVSKAVRAKVVVLGVGPDGTGAVVRLAIAGANQGASAARWLDAVRSFDLVDAKRTAAAARWL